MQKIQNLRQKIKEQIKNKCMRQKKQQQQRFKEVKE